jgi:chaperone modulatory protein CbpM
MNESFHAIIEGQLLDDECEISLRQLCRRCATEAEIVHRLIEEGIIEPSRSEGETLYFSARVMRRTRIVVRLRSDLGVNLAGAALALELLDQIDELERNIALLRS